MKTLKKISGYANFVLLLLVGISLTLEGFVPFLVLSGLFLTNNVFLQDF